MDTKTITLKNTKQNIGPLKLQYRSGKRAGPSSTRISLERQRYEPEHSATCHASSDYRASACSGVIHGVVSAHHSVSTCQQQLYPSGSICISEKAALKPAQCTSGCHGSCNPRGERRCVTLVVQVAATLLARKPELKTRWHERYN